MKVIKDNVNTDFPFIGIAGFGFVGQALYASIKENVFVAVADKFKNLHHYGEIEPNILQCIFICLPTPMNPQSGEQDVSALNEYLGNLVEAEYRGLVVVKSTVLYHNVAGWEKKLNIVCNPEFLNQNSAPDDFANQNMVVLGGSSENTVRVREIYRKCFNLPEETSYQLVSAEEACNFKYLHNIYHAYQVLFWNYVQQLTGNSRKYVALYEKLYGRKPILSQIAPDGSPGYGGACFPKDVNAMQQQNPHLLTEFMCRFNALLRPDVESASAVSSPCKGEVDALADGGVMFHQR